MGLCLSLSLHKISRKSIKDYFNVAQLENHGPNHADHNSRKRVHVWRRINKNFTRNLLLAKRCSIFFLNDKLLQERRLAVRW